MTAATRLPLSVCIVASNEAHRISKALESVSGWTSEIIVVLNDNVSDGTDKIAESYGAKVFREPWKGFIGQKNSVAEKCGQPWLLNLDADEVRLTWITAGNCRGHRSGGSAVCSL